MKLIAVTNDRMANELLLKTLMNIANSIDAIILREKSKTDAEVIDLIQKLLAAGVAQNKIIVHGRADIAVQTGIKKVQLPDYGVPLTLAKTRFPTISFGRSIHSFEGAEVAYKDGADWLLYGHLFTTESKERLPPRGTTELIHITASLPIPIYAIGGIKPNHLPLLQKTGVSGIAVMSSIFDSANPSEVVATYQKGEFFHAANH